VIGAPDRIDRLPVDAPYPQGAVTPSAIGEVLRCSALYKFRRVDRLETERSAALRWKLLLRAASAGFARGYRLATSDAALPERLAEARRAAREAALAELQRGDGEIVPEIIAKLDAALVTLESRTWMSGTPLEGGERYVLHIEGCAPIVAQVDFVVERDGEPVVIVVDAGRDSDEALERADRNERLTAACLAYELAHGRAVRHAEVHLFAREHAKVAIVPTTRGTQSYARLECKARSASRTIAERDFRPTDSYSVCVSCPYSTACTSTYGAFTA